jgi:hypothetical protein
VAEETKENWQDKSLIGRRDTSSISLDTGMMIANQNGIGDNPAIGKPACFLADRNSQEAERAFASSMLAAALLFRGYCSSVQYCTLLPEQRHGNWGSHGH